MKKKIFLLVAGAVVLASLLLNGYYVARQSLARSFIQGQQTAANTLLQQIVSQIESTHALTLTVPLADGKTKTYNLKEYAEPQE